MPGDTAAEYFGRALASARAERGLKRMQLKELSGLSYPYISEIENGGKYPSQRAIQALAAALDVTPSELVARAEKIESSAATPGQAGLDVPVEQSIAVPVVQRQDALPLPSHGDDDVTSRLVERVIQAVRPHLREWLLKEAQMAVAEELHRQKGDG